MAIPLAVLLVIYVLVPVCRGIGWCVGQVFRFIGGEVGDAFRMVGAIITALVFAPLIVGSILIGRWSASAHFGRALQGEVQTAFKCVYRMVVGHPARLLCLTSLTEGIEKRLPEIVAATPGADKPSKKRAGQFDGYTIIGSLKGGGSGAKLYVAEPDAVKRATFERQGQADVGQVVIKNFSLSDGSSLPQIVRESRSLDAAKKLGLVLDHELNDQRFFYIMRYVPGESLSLVTQRLHADSGSKGLGDRALAQTMGYVGDLVSTLETYHSGGLWHKDVKPDNIIVDGESAHLVDFGLLSSLRSSMTLTTHGTEYFRDPELVRMALKGVKVHQVNGAKFDIYAAGAVLFSMVENSFPAHGGLSQISKRCPEALRWIVRRAMTDYDKRYESASAMLADLRVVSTAKDPFAIKPMDLPSMSGAAVPFVPQEPAEAMPPMEPRVAQASPVHPMPPVPPVPAAAGARVASSSTVVRHKPRLRVANWWTGRYDVEGEEAVEVEQRQTPRPPRPRGWEASVASASASVEAVKANLQGSAARADARRRVSEKLSSRRFVPAGAGHPLGLSAHEQVERARERAARTRERAMSRAGRRPGKANKNFSTNPNSGVAIGIAAVLGLAAIGVAVLAMGSLLAGSRSQSVAVVSGSGGSGEGVEGIARAGAGFGLDAASASSTSGDVSRLFSDRRVMVLRDTLWLSPSSTEQIDRRLIDLHNRGVDLVGSIPPGVQSTRTEEDVDAQTDLAAQLLFEIGVSPWKSQGAQDRIGDWLDEHDEIDAVVWIARDPKNDKRIAVWPIRSAKMDRGDFDAMVRVLSGDRD
ncbi:hypothetical protein JYU07_00680 [Roseiflexus sp. AH-315-K22]|nr:hypothetical protein [Roseiflexus sp. AH-315-K22]